MMPATSGEVEPDRGLSGLFPMWRTLADLSAPGQDGLPSLLTGRYPLREARDAEGTGSSRVRLVAHDDDA
jgi:hypothetical protein